MTAGVQTRLTQARSWADYQALLRSLHVECGTPKYDAVSARGGLPKSAVSGLIGRNPQRRPTESASLRFVAACLAHAGVAPDLAAVQVEEWRTAWRRLATLDEAGGHVERPMHAAPVATRAVPTPVGRRWSNLRWSVTVGVAALACVAAFVLGAVVWQQFAPAGHPAAFAAADAHPAADAPATASRGGCTPGQARIPDARLKRKWDGVFLCENDRSLMYRWPTVDGMPTAVLRTSPSWFICWTRGQEVGGDDVWYYTQGDDPLTDPPIPSTWGFLPASSVHSAAHPAAGLTRQCTFPTEPAPR